MGSDRQKQFEELQEIAATFPGFLRETLGFYSEGDDRKYLKKQFSPEAKYNDAAAVTYFNGHIFTYMFDGQGRIDYGHFLHSLKPSEKQAMKALGVTTPQEFLALANISNRLSVRNLMDRLTTMPGVSPITALRMVTKLFMLTRLAEKHEFSTDAEAFISPDVREQFERHSQLLAQRGFPPDIIDQIGEFVGKLPKSAQDSLKDPQVRQTLASLFVLAKS